MQWTGEVATRLAIVDNRRIVDNHADPEEPLLKITDVEAIILRQPALDDGIADGSQDDLVIKIHTDEGIVGIGEVDSAPEAVAALVNRSSSHAIAGSLRELLVGEDPRDVERLWQKMYRGLIYIGRRGIALHALSGIDIALWDIKGKSEGKPVHELLGGARHEKVRAYAARTEEIPWRRVTRVPPHVYFSHRRHVALGGIACADCHGAVAEAAVALTTAAVSLDMASCMGCHAQRGASNDCNACHR